MARKILSQEIREKIEELIGTEFLPGDKIPSEEELCRRFDVSRATVREAIRELISSSVLKVQRGVGTFVTEHPGLVDDPLGIKFMNADTLQDEIWETSLFLEPQFAAWVAERAVPEEIDALEAVQDEYESIYQEWLKEPDEALTKEMFRLDGEFHLMIAEMTKNTVLYYIFRAYCRLIFDEIEYTVAERNTNSIRHYHRLLIDDFRRRDTVLARQHMLEHDRELQQQYLATKAGN